MADYKLFQQSAIRSVSGHTMKDSAVGVEYTGEDTPPYAVFPLNRYNDFGSPGMYRDIEKSGRCRYKPGIFIVNSARRAVS